MKVSIFHIKERVWTIALFSLIACLGSVVIGMLLGYSTNTLSELSTLQEGGDEKYVIANGTWPAQRLIPVMQQICTKKDSLDKKLRNSNCLINYFCVLFWFSIIS